MQRRDFLFMTAAAALLAGCAGKGATTSMETSGIKFSESERKTIETYYSAQRRGPATLPPQRAKPGDVLDPGQRPNKLPGDLLGRLPDLPAPYTRLVLGGDIILVNRDTHVIADVIPQVAY